MFTYKDWLNRNKMASANDSGDDEEEVDNRKKEPDDRLKVTGTRRRNCE
jgi:hypothetical protein